jgi:hypothetical protein
MELELHVPHFIKTNQKMALGSFLKNGTKNLDVHKSGIY